MSMGLCLCGHCHLAGLPLAGRSLLKLFRVTLNKWIHMSKQDFRGFTEHNTRSHWISTVFSESSVISWIIWDWKQSSRVTRISQAGKVTAWCGLISSPLFSIRLSRTSVDPVIVFFFLPFLTQRNTQLCASVHQLSDSELSNLVELECKLMQKGRRVMGKQVKDKLPNMMFVQLSSRWWPIVTLHKWKPFTSSFCQILLAFAL